MTDRPRLAGSAPLPILAAVALAELVVNRLAVPALRPVRGIGEAAPVIPGWFRALDYLGLFLFYFLATLAVVVLAMVATRTVVRWRTEVGRGDRLGAGLTLVGATIVGSLVAASLLVGHLGATLSMVVEGGLLVLIVALLVRACVRPASIGVAIGAVLLVVPLLVHAYGVIAARWWWSDGGLDGEAGRNLQLGLATMALLGLASPYTLGPRPLARAMTRIVPIVLALSVSGLLLVLLRVRYDVVADLGNRGLGLGLRRELPDPRMAMFVLALATLTWTLVACATDDVPARRRLGLGLLLVVVCGSGLGWPAYVGVVAVGLIVLADQAGHVQPAVSPVLAPVAPPIDDGVWQGFVTQTVTALRARGAQVQALTSRGSDDDTTTVIAVRLEQRPLQLRILRRAGSVTAIDARFGRDLLAERKPPTFALVARRDQLLGEAHAEAPGSGPQVRIGDARFDARFRCRGELDAISAMLDEGLRDRLLLTAEGWLAVWVDGGVRSVVHPGRGASLDQPLPLAELAGRGQVGDASARLLAWLDTLAALAARAMPADAEPVPDAPDADESMS